MTTKKTASRKKAGTGKTARKKKAPASGQKGVEKTSPDVLIQLKKIGLGVLILVTVCLTGAMVADLLIRQPRAPVPEKTAEQPVVPPDTKDMQKKSVSRESSAGISKEGRDTDHISPQTGMMEKNGRPVLYEVFEETHDLPKPVSDERPPARKGDGWVEIALIIDDIGYDQKMAMDLYELEPNISFSILPWSPKGQTIAGILKDKGAQIMLHLPMEPVQYPDVNPGPGALLASMSPDALIAQLEKNLDDVPGASGVNNHMGSRLTTEAVQMYQVFTILKKRNLFFIDSMTAPKSQCRAAARMLQVRFGERDVFLDNIQEIDYITGQFARLKKIALKYGSAVGIGHPYPATLATLKAELPKIKGKIRVVHASRMVTIPG